MGKLDNMQDQMDNISREMEAIRKTQMAMLEMKTKNNIVTQIPLIGLSASTHRRK